MNLLDLMVRIGVDDQVSGKLGGIGDKAKSALATVGKVGVAMAGAAAGAIGVTSKAALDAYASYEQLVGGVQTLFGAGGKTLEAYAESVGQTVDSASAKYGELIEAQEKMFVYADAAYASAGVSANRYMEQATSFAASLVSSLGGDTKAAVEYADMAIRDMSDNANKMGTDVASIQWAYQGFAKQNYTMLDNLKLGYGGTKSEMERLISDANKIKEKMGEVGDLSIDSFADIVEAIHLVQVEMGVFGTTAEEAATTIQGSLGMLRASWENWLTELGKDDADMAKLTDRLARSFETAAENLLPRLAAIVGTLIGEIPGIAADVGPVLAESIGTTFSAAFEAFKGMLPQDVQDALARAGNKVRETFEPVVKLIGDKLPGALERAGSWAKRLGKAFEPVVESMVELAAKVIPMVVGFLESLGAAIDRWVVPALEDLAPKLERLLDSLGPLLEKLEPLADLLGTAFGAALYNIVTQLGLIAEAVAVAVEAFTALSDAFDNAGAKAREFVDDVGDGLGRLREVVEPALEAAKAAVASWAVQMAANAVTAGTRFVGSIALWLATLPTRVKGFLDGVIAKLPPWAQDMARGAVEGAESFVSSLLGELASLPRKVYQSGVSIVSGLIGGIRSMADSAGRAMAGVVSSIAAYLPRSPAKKGALSGRGWSLYSGKAIVSALAEGIDADGYLPASAMARVMEGVSAQEAEVGVRGSSRNGRDAGGSGGVSIGELHVHVDQMASIEQWRGFVSMLRAAKAMA